MKYRHVRRPPLRSNLTAGMEATFVLAFVFLLKIYLIYGNVCPYEYWLISDEGMFVLFLAFCTTSDSFCVACDQKDQSKCAKCKGFRFLDKAGKCHRKKTVADWFIRIKAETTWTPLYSQHFEMRF